MHVQIQTLQNTKTTLFHKYYILYVFNFCTLANVLISRVCKIYMNILEINDFPKVLYVVI